MCSVMRLFFAFLLAIFAVSCSSDRREAIKAAAALAHPGDIILIAGKGHETYQIIGDETRHFDDKEEIIRRFEEM